MAGVQVPQGALKSEAALANNVIPGRPKRALSTLGTLQRARDVTAASARQLLGTAASGVAAGRGQLAFAGIDPICLF